MTGGGDLVTAAPGSTGIHLPSFCNLLYGVWPLWTSTIFGPHSLVLVTSRCTDIGKFLSKVIFESRTFDIILLKVKMYMFDSLLSIVVHKTAV